MERATTLKEFEQQWNDCLQTKSSLDRVCAWMVAEQPSMAEANDDDDPYDCHDLRVPPLYELVEQAAGKCLPDWKDLDERKISVHHQHQPSNHDNDDNDALPHKKGHPRRPPKTLPKWYESHVRLPYNFDYASRLSEPSSSSVSLPTTDSGMDDDDQVISLDDPTKTLSYRDELWKIFARIPTAEQLEHDATVGMNLPCTEHVCAQIKELSKGSNRLDGHALSRLRLTDRHQLPPPAAVQSKHAEWVTSLRFECWRRQPGRGVSPDPNRMIVELLGSQTLLDLHNTIVELSDDELWSKQLEGEDNATAESSGYFFFENVFYTTGPVDYVTPVLNWLRCGSPDDQRFRALQLGITTADNLAVQPMSSLCLEDLSLRLAFRYVHIHHGDVECSIMLVDRRYGPKAMVPYPIVHDIWKGSFVIPICEACHTAPASLATSTSCERTDGHHAVCESCARQLQLQTKVPDQIEKFTVWRGQGDLSAGACTDTVL